MQHAAWQPSLLWRLPPGRVQVYEGLNAISEAVGPQFVMAELHKRAAANKNPKVGRAGKGWTALLEIKPCCPGCATKPTSLVCRLPTCAPLSALALPAGAGRGSWLDGGGHPGLWAGGDGCAGHH